MARTRTDALLLGEWACLGLLTRAPAHGYDLAVRLAPSGDVGRVWSLSRSLTYRALDQLGQRDLIALVGEERGKAGGTRTILRATSRGRRLVRHWLQQPVPHLRDVRAELLLKLVLCEIVEVDERPLLTAQRAAFAPMVKALGAAQRAKGASSDPVAVWRLESSRAVLRFIDRMIAAHGDPVGPAAR